MLVFILFFCTLSFGKNTVETIADFSIVLSPGLQPQNSRRNSIPKSVHAKIH